MIVGLFYLIESEKNPNVRQNHALIKY